MRARRPALAPTGALALVLAASGCPDGGGGQPPDVNVKGPFGQGRDAYLAGRYADAQAQLEAYLQDHPNGNRVDLAHLYLAKSHLAQGDHTAARASFEAAVGAAPQGKAAHKARYKLACLNLVEGDVTSAQAGFAAVAREQGLLSGEAQAFATALAGGLKVELEEGE